MRVSVLPLLAYLHRVAAAGPQTAARQLNDLRPCVSMDLLQLSCSALPALANGKSCRQNGIIKMTFLAGKTHKIINRPNALDIWPERGSGLAGSTPATWLDEVASTVLNCFCGKTPAEGVIGPFRATLGTFFFSSARLRSILIRFEVFSEKRTRSEEGREERGNRVNKSNDLPNQVGSTRS